MTVFQITWLLSRGFSVQQLTDSGHYLLVRGECVVFESPVGGTHADDWCVRTPHTTLRMPLRECVKLAVSK